MKKLISFFAVLLCTACAQEQPLISRPTSGNPEGQAPVNTQNARFSRAVLPPNCALELRETAIAFSELELNDGCVMYFDPSIKAVNMTVVKLVLHGISTIDLTPRVAFPMAPDKPPQPKQAHNEPPTQRGENGAQGGAGAPGKNGIGLNLSVQNMVADDGALWIKTDGTPGGPGGDGGDGAKGAGPNTIGAHCWDGGAGGDGGRGGDGGKGGATAKVKLTVGQNSISPTKASGVAPSVRPSEANMPGTIVVAGSPGPGGRGGRGGNGGTGGEGRECSFPRTDAKPGPHGANGPNGSNGLIGDFTP